jgi:hypothetical protein
MPQIDTKELERLIEQGETLTLELKVAPPRPGELGEAVVRVY